MGQAPAAASQVPKGPAHGVLRGLADRPQPQTSLRHCLPILQWRWLTISSPTTTSLAQEVTLSTLQAQSQPHWT